ncbi:aspartate/glutamate racemase family protein [Kistimonas asteriae]|uniref:aspartate/glutamate racemase family protein n=1 Tax=Kistimonas asteriae TaxID=517724 RepID=UPI001BADE30B|nr:aspartate/glutamate racemase family protein [Kistimonas asteriae]
MKTIGLLGGMSWESTASHYRAINDGIRKTLGGLHSAKLCLYSVDFEEIETLQQQGRWDDAGVILARAAQSVEAGGADFLLLCTNTMHKVVPAIEAAISIPLLHIADATAEQLVNDNVSKVGLLGTQFTMAQDFYKGRLTNRYGIDVLVPHEQEQIIVHNIIYSELCMGRVTDESREQYLDIIDQLAIRGAEVIILGCTEIGLLVKPYHTSVSLYDTTTLHAERAVSMALHR